MRAASKLSDAFRAAKIINTWDLLTKFATKETAYAISYHGHGGAVGYYAAFWSPLRDTDPKAAWYCHGKKCFFGRRPAACAEAIAWAKEQGHDFEWIPCPLIKGDLVPASVLKAAKDWLKAQPKVVP